MLLLRLHRGALCCAAQFIILLHAGVSVNTCVPAATIGIYGIHFIALYKLICAGVFYIEILKHLECSCGTVLLTLMGAFG